MKAQPLSSSLSASPAASSADHFDDLLAQIDATLEWTARHGRQHTSLFESLTRLRRQMRQARRFDTGQCTYGRIADLRLLHSLPLRLPFPQISLTFETTTGKHVVLAQEVSASNASDMLAAREMSFIDVFSDGAIWIQGFSCARNTAAWAPGSIGLLVSRRWLHRSNPSDASLTLNALPLPALDHDGEITSHAIDLAYTYLGGLLAFCEALASEDLRQDVAHRATKQRMAPIDPLRCRTERHWRPAPRPEPAVIRLGAPRYMKTPSARPGLRHGPCEHYRRGHWRRLARERIVWVNPCLVGVSDGEYKNTPAAKKHYIVQSFS